MDMVILAAVGIAILPADVVVQMVIRHVSTYHDEKRWGERLGISPEQISGSRRSSAVRRRS